MRSSVVIPLQAGGSISGQAIMIGTSRADFCSPTRVSRPTTMHRIAISAAPDTGDSPATIATGARKPMTIAAMTANRRPPEATAAMPAIAGSEAEAAAEKLLGPAADRGAKGEATAESTSPAGKPKAHPGKSVSKASKKPDRSQAARQGEAKSDGLLEPMERVDKNAVVAGTRAGDADQAAKSFEQESWFAKLPPEMRQAIRAKSQRRAPRGYEEKLDRYFRNID